MSCGAWGDGGEFGDGVARAFAGGVVVEEPPGGRGGQHGGESGEVDFGSAGSQAGDDDADGIGDGAGGAGYGGVFEGSSVGMTNDEVA